MNRQLSKSMFGLLLIAILVVSSPISTFARGEKDGYIYGKIETKSGNSYVGNIRWGTEEAFWDDFFNSTKSDNPNRKFLDRYSKKDAEEKLLKPLIQKEKEALRLEQEAYKKNDKTLIDAAEKYRKEVERQRIHAERIQTISKRSKNISIFGGSIQVNFDGFASNHIFEVRFGDIKKIKVEGSEEAEVTIKNDQVFEVSGGSNDVEGEVTIQDATIGEVKVPWKKIETVEFMATPATISPVGTRLYGTVESEAGSFQGFIQWDEEECLTTDKLDGDSDDGRMSIAMGSIRSISRKSSSSSRVELKDNRQLVLEGTNDVDESNRGIMVEDPRFGRVIVPWDVFEKVTFTDIGNSGTGYHEFPIPKALTGVVTDEDGKTYTGRIVYDLDEAYTCEILSGQSFDVDYHIPFSKIASISPKTSHSSRIELVTGEKITLEGSGDVDSSNNGILIYKDGNSEPEYLYWEEIASIKFDK